MERTGKMLPRMPVRLGRAWLDRDTRSPRPIHGDPRAREDVPAHDEMDERMWLEGEEEPWELGETRRKEGACDSLVRLSHEVAADAHAHHTLGAHSHARAVSLVGSRVAVGSSDLALASASPVAARAHRRWLEEDHLAVDTLALDLRLDSEWVRRSSDADRQYEQAQRPMHGKRRV